MLNWKDCPPSSSIVEYHDPVLAIVNQQDAPFGWLFKNRSIFIYTAKAAFKFGYVNPKERTKSALMTRLQATITSLTSTSRIFLPYLRDRLLLKQIEESIDVETLEP
jgi:hypothetical protein